MVIQIIGYFQKIVNRIWRYFQNLYKNNVGGEKLIYENICKFAKKCDISINKLEEKANVSTGSICKWGRSVSPTVKNRKKVADVLGCTVDELIAGENNAGKGEE